MQALHFIHYSHYCSRFTNRFGNHSIGASLIESLAVIHRLSGGMKIVA